MTEDTLFDVDVPQTYKESRREILLAHTVEPCSIESIRGTLDMSMVRYEDDGHLLVEGDSLELLAAMPDQCVDLVITDPPYAENTHKQAKSNRGGPRGHGVKLVHFSAFDDEALYAAFAHMGRLTRRWVIATVDYKHAFMLEQEPPEGLAVLRIGVWVKTNPMPQISGDRPGQGWESIVFMHRTDIGPTWTGGGRSSVWQAPVARGQHPTMKPIEILRDWVRLFSEPGDLVLDPFAGSASTAVAAKAEGRRSVSIERDPQWIPYARDRLAQEVLL